MWINVNAKLEKGANLKSGQHAAIHYPVDFSMYDEIFRTVCAFAWEMLVRINVLKHNDYWSWLAVV